MPAVVEAVPLAVVFTFPGGHVHCGFLGDLPDPVLAGDLAAALAAAAHPHGPIRTRSVARQYCTTVRRFARDLHEQGFAGPLTALSPATVIGYWLACDFHRERRLRAVLAAFEQARGGLDPQVLAHLAGRRINQITKSTPNQPYSDMEWKTLAAACDATITAARAAHRQALRDLAEDPGTDGQVLRLLTGRGPSETAAVCALLPEAGRARTVQAHRALFPDGHTAFAYLTLFSMRTGIVPDGIDTLRLDDFVRTGEHTGLLSYYKGRTGRETLNLPRDAVRLLEKWLEHSAPLRAHAGDLAGQMWVFNGGDGLGRGISRILHQARHQGRRQAWVAATGIVADDGTPLAVHGGRVRATYLHRRDRAAWSGRARIDPNHSARIEADHYLTSHTPAQLDALDGIIEQAQREIRAKAEPAILTPGLDAAGFAAAFPDLVKNAGLEHGAVAEMLCGAQDVFVAACANPTASPHAPAGTLCPARPWVCLLCPLAVFAQRHLPNLLRLRGFFAEQAARMSTTGFLAVFGRYADRLEQEVLPRFDPAAVESAENALRSGGPGIPMLLEEAGR
jgi:hypothetical protein